MVWVNYIRQMAAKYQLAPEQVRAARGWLDWTQQALADRAHVGLSTVKHFESGKRTPMFNKLGAIRRALEGAGVELVFDRKGKPKGVHVKSR
jgi:predicted transcriptional regulator